MTEKKQYPSDKQDQYIVRFPTGMRETIKSRAAGAGRSMNAEIVQRLKWSLDEEGDDTLKLDLPESVRDILREDANAHNMSEEERITQIISKAYDQSSDYTAAIKLISDLKEKNYLLRQEIMSFLEKENTDFLLYYGKIIQISQIIKIILSQKELIPQSVTESVDDFDNLNKVELETLKNRYIISKSIYDIDEEIKGNIESIEDEFRKNGIGGRID